MCVCTRIDKKIDVLLCLLVYGTERLLFAQASNFVEIDRPFFPPIFTTLLQQRLVNKRRIRGV